MEQQRPITGEIQPRLSLVIPAYNEAVRIEATLDAAQDALAQIDAEILVVDDGSSDNTLAIAQRIAEARPNVRVLGLKHRGKAAAVRSGMLEARGDLILFSDADLAVSLLYIPEFITMADDGADVVIASREGATASRIGEPGYRHLMGRVFNRFVQLLVLPGIEDTQCGFKLFTREAAHKILDRSALYAQDSNEVTGARVTAFDVEILVIAQRLGYRIAVKPVEWTYGEHSKVNPIRDSLLNLRDVALVKWNDLRGRYRAS